MEMSFLNCHPCFRLCTSLCKCRAWIESIMARWSQPISRIVLGLTSRKLIAWVICGVYMMIMRCTLTLAMKSYGAVSAHIFQSWVRWHCLRLLHPLHETFVIFLTHVWWIFLDEFIMLCIDYHQSLEQIFISGSTSILWQMVSVKSLCMRLEGWLQRRSTTHMMQRYLQFH